MDAIRIFDSPQFGQVRIIADEADGNILFCAKDVTDALGYTNGRKAVTDHVDEPDVTKRDIGVVTGKKADGTDACQTITTTFITESGVYSLIFGSKQERAKDFKRWVTHEVLPSIRKTGRYCTGKSRQNTSQLLNAKMKVASWVIKTLNLSEASKLAIAKSIADPLGLPTPDYVKTPDATAAASQLLKECGAKMSALAFNRMLVQQGYLAEMERTAAKGMRKTFKCITKKGLYYGENGVSPHNPKETQPRWYVSKFKDLLSVVTNNIKETEANNG